MTLSPLARRRLEIFRQHRRGWWSLWLFLLLFGLSLFANILANDKPLVIRFEGHWMFPMLKDYPETRWGGSFLTTADYRDPYVQSLINRHGWMLWPPLRFSDQSINYDLDVPTPAPPSRVNLLGTDDQGRDVLARLIYGFRLSIVFALILSAISSVIGIAAGALMGYYGGWVDLAGQRIMEVWSGLPMLYLLIIISSMFAPSFWWLLGIMLLFSWMHLVDLVRAEFLRGRNMEYVRAARALGLSNTRIILRHLLPNAMVSTMTYLPFVVTGAIATLNSLDFLGFGLPPGSPSLGELLSQGKANLDAPWLALTAFFSLGTILTLLIFIGEAVRDAFDPRHSPR
ncbi:MAG: ABC transporter permease [Pseudomonadales bacterium]|nr:ABC transporter permease [Pseudomonadales bacterium]